MSISQLFNGMFHAQVTGRSGRTRNCETWYLLSRDIWSEKKSPKINTEVTRKYVVRRYVLEIMEGAICWHRIRWEPSWDSYNEGSMRERRGRSLPNGAGLSLLFYQPMPNSKGTGERDNQCRQWGCVRQIVIQIADVESLCLNGLAHKTTTINMQQGQIQGFKLY